MFLENRDACTPVGTFRGVPAGNPGYTLFKGIPFAKAGRFERPTPAPSFEGIYVCDTFPPAAPQVPGRNKGAGLYHKEFKPAAVNESEDCLYLNLWTPTLDPKAKLPVMVYIHGGGFVNGYSYEMEFDGEAFCKRDTLLVSIPYRLAGLGFFAHPELSQKSITSGNYAVYDAIEALKFVHANIASFGGDPNNITLFGQSAGGVMTQVLCTSLLTKGLFQHTIIQSAGGLLTPIPPLPLKEAEAQGEAILKVLEMTLSDLLAVDDLKANALLLGALPKLEEPFRFSPIIDGAAVMDAPMKLFAQGKNHPIDYLIGSVEEDGAFFPMTSLVDPEDPLAHLSKEDFQHTSALANPLTLSKAAILNHQKPIYTYFFNRRMPGDTAGAFHSAELWYVFGTLSRCWRSLEEGFTPGDYALSDQMLDYWTNFAFSGDPSQGKRPVPAWDPYTTENPAVMLFNETLPGQGTCQDVYPLAEALSSLALASSRRSFT